MFCERRKINISERIETQSKLSLTVLTIHTTHARTRVCLKVDKERRCYCTSISYETQYLKLTCRTYVWEISHICVSRINTKELNQEIDAFAFNFFELCNVFLCNSYFFCIITLHTRVAAVLRKLGLLHSLSLFEIVMRKQNAPVIKQTHLNNLLCNLQNNQTRREVSEQNSGSSPTQNVSGPWHGCGLRSLSRPSSSFDTNNLLHEAL